MAKRKKQQTKKRLKLHTMDLILVIIAVALLVFTIDMRNTFKETGAVPDVLVTCVFAALAGECGAMAWIKTTKEKLAERKQRHRNRDNDETQQDNEAKE